MIPQVILQYLEHMSIRVIDTHGNPNTICIIAKCSHDKVLPLLEYDDVQGMVSTIQKEYHYIFVTPH
ncbi:MAG: hypothetical protein CTY12_00500 [Methylotenera sp.]|nr:MAG: hypothetical protein CTY12_00500 [Methylotenera sp.]